MRTVSRGFGMVAVAALAVSTGCLRKEVTHTFYISPGGVTWSVIEKDVRSDEPDPAKRLGEEHDYRFAAGTGRHPVAAALALLGGREIRTTWLRRERPFTVMTEARFVGLRDLVEAILRDAGIPGEVGLAVEKCRTTFALRANVAETGGAADETATGTLSEELDRYRIVLTEGRFDHADGFVVDPDGVVATPDTGKGAVDGVLTLALTWTTCRPPD